MATRAATPTRRSSAAARAHPAGCTTPIGYHPSVYGAYLSALVLFDEITGVSPQSLLPEFDPSYPGYDDSAAYGLGISPEIARELAMIAGETVRVGHPIPEPGSLVLLSGIVGIFAVRKRRGAVRPARVNRRRQGGSDRSGS